MTNSKGFTLIELMLYTLLAAFILLLLPQFISRALFLRAQAEQYQVLDRTGFHVLQQLTQSIRYSDSISADEAHNQLYLDKGSHSYMYFVENEILYQQDTDTMEREHMVPANITVEDFSIDDVSLSANYPSLRLSIALREKNKLRTFSTAASRRQQEK
ncbi:prepilin-type N-terminal cleavage/methylation domain-containing protein [Patescibacteria group bacterium]|nr:prepilin-type N-terminal cleavage/methylation domain-containing protein [Patescibacteria group bacterium]